ncbi:short-chain dehydrogenase/reductase SDR [Psychromonas ingrahamii 37]|uniref:Short-chain dehydrogenase/reductase SDR n=1 Tax=Psychromonas ingrahamii (strain DSM 17664 / CCUG 51855 / 37) TaxID=357804 RepID=A1SW76_PSYIN|nr:YciK family oxidoreductase [Psychromonas ingrahamii]ABM03741.1 short-chain dehydrogenase/reductase SDR [Psychromonas ingrahamii 37]
MNEFKAQPDSLNGKTILITGAGAGIGKTLALHCATLGAKVILLGKTVKKLEAVYDQIELQGKQQAAILPVDLNGATEEHYADLADTIKREYGKLDALVHNASQLGVLGPFAQIEKSTWDEIIQTNVTAQFLLTKALIPVLSLAPQASVIFTTSSVGHAGRAYWGAYSISKFASEGMMQVLADEYEHSSLRFNAINPGATRTEMRASAYPAEDSSLLKTATDIMPSYLYLLSDASKGVTGQRINAQ